MIQGFVDLWTLSDWYVLLLIAFALVCLCIEMFTFSFSIVGLTGIVLGFLGLWLGISDNWSLCDSILWVIADILIIFILVLVSLKLIAIHFKNKKIRAKTDYLLIDGNKIPADKMGNPDFSFLIGKTGECITDLKPSGKVKIDGKIYNVLSEKNYLYNGNAVKVVKTVSASIYVEKIKHNRNDD